MQHNGTVDLTDFEPLAPGGPAWPEDFQGIDFVPRPQAEMDARIVAGEIAVSTQAKRRTFPSSCGSSDAGSDGFSFSGHRQHLKPMVLARGAVIAEYAHRVVEIYPDEI